MPEIFAYTDGACSGNPGPGGWGVILQAKEDHNIIKERELYGGELETKIGRAHV
jgi:ribonuclease HI